MNQPFILQRFELNAKYPLIIEGNKFKMEKCSAIGYLALKQGAESQEFLRRMEQALNEQYGRQMEIIVAEQKNIDADGNIPEALIFELQQYMHLPFMLKYIPAVEDEKWYNYFNGRLIPTLMMTLFVPQNHKLYFNARSEHLHYNKIQTIGEWQTIENEVEQLCNQNIPFVEWYPQESK